MDGKEYTVSEVIDRIGISGHTWAVFFLMIIAMIFDGYDYMVVNSCNTYIARTFWPDLASPGTMLGSLTTWGLLGMVLGGAFGGILSDRIGRKRTLVIAVIWYGVFTLPQGFAPNYGVFVAFRLIAGFGVGSCIPVVTTVFSESIPSKNRGTFVTFGMAGMVAGWVIAGLIANPICSTETAIFAPLNELVNYTAADGSAATMYANWRWCFLIGAIPIIYGLILIPCMKETPHWFANQGRKEDAVKALHDIAESTAHIDIKLDPNLMVVPPRPKSSGPAALFSSRFIIGTASIWCAYFCGQFCVYGMNAWIPSWFQGVGYSASASVALQTWNNVAAILSNICAGIISDRMGRKRALIMGWILCVVAILLCSIFVAPNAMALCVVLMLIFGFCLNLTITFVQPLMPEAYPTSLRNTGVSWCQAFARFGGSGSSIVLGAIAGMAMFQNASGGTNWSQVVLTLNIIFILGLICAILFTRNTAGKSMDSLASESAATFSETDGNSRFIVMCVVIAVNFVGCIVLPLAISGFSSQSYALPVMLVAMILPFIYFFVYGGIQLGKERSARGTAAA